jgi:hypothetical protein
MNNVKWNQRLHFYISGTPIGMQDLHSITVLCFVRYCGQRRNRTLLLFMNYVSYTISVDYTIYYANP